MGVPHLESSLHGAYCAIVLACVTSAVLSCACRTRDRIVGIAFSRWLVLR